MVSRAGVIVAAAALASLLARTAMAAPKDEAVLKIRDQAIYTDYLATNFAAAEGKLAQAMAMCGDGADCDPAVRARLECDLGVVFFSDQKLEDAKAHFVLALKEDPNVSVHRDLATPELQRFFASAKNAGTPAPSDAGAPPASPEEDLAYTVPPAQTVLTPVPVYVVLPTGVEAVKVNVRFKAFGVERWKTANLSRLGAGWGERLGAPTSATRSAT